jgi:MerR family copper efflux transcriptional regulator
MEVQYMINLQNYLRIKQAAEFLGVSESTLRNWERNGKITTYRHPISRYRLYKKADLENLLEEVEKSAKHSSIGNLKREKK